MNFDNYVCEGQTTIFDYLPTNKDKMLRKIKMISLFSGIGAFEKALDRLEVDYELVGYSEIDKYASKSYSAIHGVPESMNLGDITKIDEKELPKDIDLITYGFPCQDISMAGKQKGLFNEDGTQTRSGLFFDALRVIEEIKPRVAIAENVKNLTSKKFSEQFKIVLESLEEAGYNNYWQVLNAKDYGIPQNRERVFIVSIRKDIDTGLFQFPKGFPLELRLKDLLEDEVDEKYYLREKGLALFEKQKETQVNRTTKNADITLLKIAHGFNPESEEDADIFPTVTMGTSCHWNTVIKVGNVNPSGRGMNGTVIDSKGLARTITTEKGEGQKILIREATKQGYAEEYECDSVNLEQLNSKTRSGRVGHGVAQTITTSPQQGVGIADVEPFIVASRGRNPEKPSDRTAGSPTVQRLEPNSQGICNTLTTVHKDNYVVEPTETSLRIRKLTPKECFRLMGFDDSDFEKAEKVNSNTQLYKQAGNSIVVPVLEHIMTALFDSGVLEKE